MYAVIMAGGFGSRLWPKSRELSPKQLQNLISDQTMLQDTIRRIRPIVPKKNITIVTSQNYLHKVKEQIPGLPDENYISEEYPWGTALGCVLTAARLVKRDPNATIIFLWCDHFIKKEKAFVNLLNKAAKAANQGYLVALGVNPTYPATGYGYIRIGKSVGNGVGYAFMVKEFIEKPNLAKAKKYADSFDYLWNSGIFVFKAKTILNEFKEHLPKHYQLIMRLKKNFYSSSENKIYNKKFKFIDKISVDKGIYEKCYDNIVVIPANIGWSDVGTWSILHNVLPKNKFGNVIKAKKHFSISTKNSLIFGGERLIATIGIHDFIIVDTDDALLILNKDYAQKVKDLTNLLKENNKEEYL